MLRRRAVPEEQRRPDGKMDSMTDGEVKLTRAQWRMPGRFETKKDAASCEKPWGAAGRQRTMDIRMGQPGGRNPVTRKGGRPGELKHLSSQRKSNQKRFP